jgi:hypothetical protein
MAQPDWWKAEVGPLWEDARTEVLGSWERVVGVQKRIPNDVAERAMELGFHARQAFEDIDSWEGKLETQLQSDWASMHHDLAWEHVSGAVKHGWEMSPQGGWLPPIAAPTERLGAR